MGLHSVEQRCYCSIEAHSLQSSKSALANLADANGCVQLAACYNDAHEKVLECEMLLKDLERKEADEEKVSALSFDLSICSKSMSFS